MEIWQKQENIKDEGVFDNTGYILGGFLNYDVLKLMNEKNTAKILKQI